MKKNTLPTWLKLWIPLAIVALLPTVGAWLQNWYQVYGVDLFVGLIVNTLVATLVFAIFYRVFLKDALAGYIGGIIATFFLSSNYESRLTTLYPILKAINPIPGLDAFGGVIFGLIIAALFVISSFYIGKLLSRLLGRLSWQPKDITGGITVALSVIFLLQMVPTIRDLVVEWPQFTYTPPVLAGNPVASTDKPDIYYIVLDRYTSSDILSSQFNFDNSGFTNFLTANGFSVNPNAHQNYPYTTMSISSTLNANYQTDIVQKFASSSEQTIDPYHEAIRKSSVAVQLQKLGYTFDEVGSWYEASNLSDVANTVYQPEGILTILGHSMTLNSFGRNQVEQSLFWRIVSQGIHIGSHTLLGYSSIDEADSTLYKVQTLHDIAQQPVGGKFVFAHILVPHDPYLFNADGSLNSNAESDNIGEPIKQKYLGQVEYINGQMEQLVTQINKNTAGKAVIIIQSDEGPYPIVLNDEDFDSNDVEQELANGSMLDWSNPDLAMKYGILAAYHVPGASAAAMAQGDDSVNIFRLVLNTYFQDNLPYLPRCYYAYVNGRAQSEVYTDITARLTGTANAACPADSNFK